VSGRSIERSFARGGKTRRARFSRREEGSRATRGDSQGARAPAIPLDILETFRLRTRRAACLLRVSACPARCHAASPTRARPISASTSRRVVVRVRRRRRACEFSPPPPRRLVRAPRVARAATSSRTAIPRASHRRVILAPAARRSSSSRPRRRAARALARRRRARCVRSRNPRFSRCSRSCSSSWGRT
jgi:hypothetical protein